jgi:hypothetical protein
LRFYEEARREVLLPEHGVGVEPVRVVSHVRSPGINPFGYGWYYARPECVFLREVFLQEVVFRLYITVEELFPVLVDDAATIYKLRVHG